MNRRQTIRATALAVIVSTAIFGCAGYSNYPAIPGSKVAIEDPNSANTERVLETALVWFFIRYPVEKGQAAAINMPGGMRKAYYERIVRNVSADGGPDLRPLTPELEHSVPVYHVGRVWVRDHEAKVDVLRPMKELGPGADGKPIYQAITVQLQGGMRPWRALAAKSWEPGIVPVPEAYYCPAVDNPNQYRIYMRERKVAATPEAAN